MNKLSKINYDEDYSEFDLSQTAPCDDRLVTKVTLDDYDWMEYTFETYFPTKAQGFLYVKIEYCGFIESQMIVKQRIDDKKYIHIITFSTDIFIEFIKDFLTKHIAQWDNTYAFSGEQEAVEIYNKILDNAITYKTQEDTKKE